MKLYKSKHTHTNVKIKRPEHLRTVNKVRTKLNNLKYMSPETQKDKRWNGEKDIFEEIIMRLSQNCLYRSSLE